MVCVGAMGQGSVTPQGTLRHGSVPPQLYIKHCVLGRCLPSGSVFHVTDHGEDSPSPLHVGEAPRGARLSEGHKDQHLGCRMVPSHKGSPKLYWCN